jgi:hypothetical protein
MTRESWGMWVTVKDSLLHLLSVAMGQTALSIIACTFIMFQIIIWS